MSMTNYANVNVDVIKAVAALVCLFRARRYHNKILRMPPASGLTTSQIPQPTFPGAVDQIMQGGSSVATGQTSNDCCGELYSVESCGSHVTHTCECRVCLRMDKNKRLWRAVYTCEKCQSVLHIPKLGETWNYGCSTSKPNQFGWNTKGSQCRRCLSQYDLCYIHKSDFPWICQKSRSRTFRVSFV